MVWGKIQNYAYVCRYGRQNLADLLGRRPSALELALFQRALANMLEVEYGSGPRELTQNYED